MPRVVFLNTVYSVMSDIFTKQTNIQYREKTKIEATTLFNDAGIIGAELSGCNLQ